MDYLDTALKNSTIRYILIGILIIIVIMVTTFFIQYNIDRSKGKHAKFLWFESNMSSNNIQHDTVIAKKTNHRDNPKKKTVKTNENQPANITNSKNINTGTNYGNIGDTYEGIEQRHFSEKDIDNLLLEINIFKKNNSQINDSHITIGYPGDKETHNLFLELIEILYDKGYEKIIPNILVTHGVTNKLYEVTNAADNSIMVSIYPADNVK